MPPTPPPREAVRIIFIFILLIWLFNTPDDYANQPRRAISPAEQHNLHLRSAQNALRILETSTYEDFSPVDGKYLNLTGFKQEDNYSWEILADVRSKVSTFSKHVLPEIEADGSPQEFTVYRNISGAVAGQWVRSKSDSFDSPSVRDRHMNVTEISPNTNWAPGVWTRNITGTQGRMKLELEEETKMPTSWSRVITLPNEKTEAEVNEISATMTIYDKSNSGEGWESRLHGLHFPSKGQAVLTTTSDKFAGLYGLPHFLGPDLYEAGRHHLFNMFNESITKEQKTNASRTARASATSNTFADDALSTPHCEYIVYLQVQAARWKHPSPDDSMIDNIKLAEIESELRTPVGLPIAEIPKLEISSIIYSPDCGFILESKGPPDYSPSTGQHLQGWKSENFAWLVKRWLLVFTSIVFGQMALTSMQMKEASTPSTLSRISLYTVGIMTLADALLFFIFSLLGSVVASFFPAAHLLSFGGLLSLAIGGRFLNEIWNVQEPERRERERERAQTQQESITTVTVAPVITAAGVDTLPPPVTANQNSVSAQPIIVPSDQDIDAEITEAANGPILPTANQPQVPTARETVGFGVIYTRFVVTTGIIFILAIHSLSWPNLLQQIFRRLMMFLYLSLWLPQIHRNVMRNCRKALLWKFVIGQSVLRLLPLTYICLNEDNIFFGQTTWTTWMVFAAYLWIQLWILFAQEVIGPRYGLPKRWMPNAWDYHPVLREDDAEAGGLPIGLIRGPDSPQARAQDESGNTKLPGDHIRSVDCAICMQVLDVPVIPIGASDDGGGVAGALGRRSYMVTPCRHIFHSACLEGWMKLRLQCPIDRETLPAL